jgi:ankyrin repeat protein
MLKESDIARQVIERLTKRDSRGILKMIREGLVEANQTITHEPTGDKFVLLTAALERGWTEVVLELIKRGAEVNVRLLSVTPLMLASDNGNLEVVKALLSAGADLEARAKKSEAGGGETALMFAAARRQRHVVQELLKAGANAKVVAPAKRTAIFAALVSDPDKKAHEVIRDLAKAGCPLLGNELHAPLFHRDVETTHLLIKLGCPVNELLERGEQHGPAKGATPLTTIVMKNADDMLGDVGETGFEPTLKRREDLVRMLLKAGADPNKPNRKGELPLALAVRCDEFQLAEVMMAAGANPQLATSQTKGQSVLDIARAMKKEKFMMLFGRTT